MASAVTSLRVAEQILADARARLPVQTMAGDELPEINAKLANDDATLDFARREFNAAVDHYNAAVRQFPTAAPRSAVRLSRRRDALAAAVPAAGAVRHFALRGDPRARRRSCEGWD